MGHDKLGNYFNTNFALMQHHHWSLSEIENMMPWERYVYIDLLAGYLKEEESKRRDIEAANKTMMRARK